MEGGKTPNLDKTSIESCALYDPLLRSLKHSSHVSSANDSVRDARFVWNGDNRADGSAIAPLFFQWSKRAIKAINRSSAIFQSKKIA